MKIPEPILAAVSAILLPYGVSKEQIERAVSGEAPGITAPTITQPLSIREACFVLNISRTTFHEWRKAGRIRCAVPCRKKVLVDRNSVMALLDSPDKTIERHTTEKPNLPHGES